MDKTEIKYGLVSLVETDYKFNYEYDYSHIDYSKAECGFMQNISPDFEKNIVTISVGAKYMMGSDTLCENHARAVFEVIPLDKVISVDSDGAIHTGEQSLVDTMLTVCIGALRGFLIKNLKGTPLEKMVLPIVVLH